jgi:hypothetical protein
MMTLLVAAMLLGAPGAGAGGGLADVADLTLVDQYGGEDNLAQHRGRVVVVMVVTARRLRNIRPWERELRAQLGDDIHYFRITDVPEGSPASREQVADKLVNRVPDGVSVLIDLDRQWATALDLDTSRPNILVVDGDGGLVAARRGRCNPELAAEVVDELKALLDSP